MIETTKFTTLDGVSGEYFVKDQLVNMKIPMVEKLFDGRQILFKPDVLLPAQFKRDIYQAIRIEIKKEDQPPNSLVLRIPIEEKADDAT
jgi:hypothetical protein